MAFSPSIPNNGSGHEPPESISIKPKSDGEALDNVVTLEEGNVLDPKQDADAAYSFHRLRTRLNVLMNDLLLNRLLTCQGLPDDGNLLIVAYELVAITLAGWTHMDLFTKERDFDFIVRYPAVLQSQLSRTGCFSDLTYRQPSS